MTEPQNSAQPRSKFHKLLSQSLHAIPAAYAIKNWFGHALTFGLIAGLLLLPLLLLDAWLLMTWEHEAPGLVQLLEASVLDVHVFMHGQFLAVKLSGLALGVYAVLLRTTPPTDLRGSLQSMKQYLPPGIGKVVLVFCVLLLVENFLVVDTDTHAAYYPSFDLYELEFDGSQMVAPNSYDLHLEGSLFTHWLRDIVQLADPAVGYLLGILLLVWHATGSISLATVRENQTAIWVAAIFVFCGSATSSALEGLIDAAFAGLIHSLLFMTVLGSIVAIVLKIIVLSSLLPGIAAAVAAAFPASDSKTPMPETAREQTQ